VADIRTALLKADTADLDDAIAIARGTLNVLTNSGEMLIRVAASAALVAALLMRGNDTDVHEAEAAIERLAAVPTEPGFVLHEIHLMRLRALLAHVHGDDTAYLDYRDRYRAMATSLGLEGHMKWAEAMP
jgi:adenylate cyclase